MYVTTLLYVPTVISNTFYKSVGILSEIPIVTVIVVNEFGQNSERSIA